MILNEENYVDQAEMVIQELSKKTDRRGKPVPMVSTSKLRGLLAMTSDIYNEAMNVQGDKLDARICERIEYLRIRFIYEEGREESVRDLVETAHLREVLKSIGGSKKRFLLFSRYMEAIVAFRKFYGKDEFVKD